MKILHIAMGSTEFDRAALELGHEVSTINWRTLTGSRFTGNAPPHLQRTILRSAQTFRPDLVFAQTHQSQVISASTYAELRNLGAFVVNWCGDVREPLPECYLEYAKQVDVMAFSNATDVDIIRAHGNRSEYLQIGYDPSIYYPGKEKRAGVVFMANNYAGRFPNSDLRAKVAAELKHALRPDFTLYGSGWGGGVRPVQGTREADIYRRSLIAVNADHFTRPYFASDRILRAQACGCATFTLAYPGCEEEHPHAVQCAGVGEMVQAIIMALDNPVATQQMGERSAAHTYAHHRWTNRIERMAKWINKPKPQNETATFADRIR